MLETVASLLKEKDAERDKQLKSSLKRLESRQSDYSDAVWRVYEILEDSDKP